MKLCSVYCKNKFLFPCYAACVYFTFFKDETEIVCLFLTEFNDDIQTQLLSIEIHLYDVRL
jgi:hypothetical protein